MNYNDNFSEYFNDNSVINNSIMNGINNIDTTINNKIDKHINDKDVHAKEHNHDNLYVKTNEKSNHVHPQYINPDTSNFINNSQFEKLIITLKKDINQLNSVMNNKINDIITKVNTVETKVNTVETNVNTAVVNSTSNTSVENRLIELERYQRARKQLMRNNYRYHNWYVDATIA